MFTLLILGIIIVFLIFVVFNESGKKAKNFPPGPPRLPIFGGYFHLLKEDYNYPHKAFIKLSKKYNTPLVGVYLGDLPTVSCHDYDLVKEIMVRDEFTDRGDNVIVRNRGFGKLPGIFFSAGEYWKDQRWFSLRHLRDFGFGRRDFDMEQNVTDEVRGLLEFFTSKPKPCDADICTEQGIVKMPDVIFGPALNSIHHSISKTHFDNYSELRLIGRTATKFLRSIDTTGNSICILPWLHYIAPNYFGWTSSIEDTKILINFAKRVVDEHRRTFSEDHIRDFIDVYLSEMKYLKDHGKDNTSFTDQQLEFTVLDYMFPSPVGVGHTLNILFAYLINQPDIQVKIQEEIDRVVGRARLPTLDDRKDMPYTEATLREGIRKDPIVPLGLGRCATKDTTLAGYSIPKGTILFPNIYGTHSDPRIWGDPENFRPERFLDDEGNLLRKDMTLGFGAGKRLCAGETFARNTMFLFVSGILQNFSLDVAYQKKPIDVSKPWNGIAMGIDDYYMKVTPRP